MNFIKMNFLAYPWQQLAYSTPVIAKGYAKKFVLIQFMQVQKYVCKKNNTFVAHGHKTRTTG